MHVAYLILAHENPGQLLRLTQALNDGGDRTFVHLSKGCDIDEFTVVAQQPNVELIRDRVSVNWGGYSMLEAQLNLMRRALDDADPPHYLCTMSASDYPLHSNEYIHSLLERNAGAEFINVVHHSERQHGESIGRLERFVLDPGMRRETGSPLKLACYYMNEKVLAADSLRRNWGKSLGGLEPYFGVSWWVLSAEAVRYIVDYVSDNPAVMRFVRHTAHPNEFFAQTVIGNSPLADRVRNTLTYEDWLTPAQSPQWLDDGHIDSIEAAESPEYSFARKFPRDRPDLLDRVDRELRGREAHR